jgi:hypothetical protein
MNRAFDMYVKVPQKLVRTDHSTTSIDKFLVSQHSNDSDAGEEEGKKLPSNEEKEEILPPAKRMCLDDDASNEEGKHTYILKTLIFIFVCIQYYLCIDVDPQSLSSILNMQERIRTRGDRMLSKVYFVQWA